MLATLWTAASGKIIRPHSGQSWLWQMGQPPTATSQYNTLHESKNNFTQNYEYYSISGAQSLVKSGCYEQSTLHLKTAGIAIIVSDFYSHANFYISGLFNHSVSIYTTQCLWHLSTYHYISSVRRIFFFLCTNILLTLSLLRYL